MFFVCGFVFFFFLGGDIFCEIFSLDFQPKPKIRFIVIFSKSKFLGKCKKVHFSVITNIATLHRESILEGPSAVHSRMCGWCLQVSI